MTVTSKLCSIIVQPRNSLVPMVSGSIKNFNTYSFRAFQQFEAQQQFLNHCALQTCVLEINHSQIKSLRGRIQDLENSITDSEQRVTEIKELSKLINNEDASMQIMRTGLKCIAAAFVFNVTMNFILN